MKPSKTPIGIWNSPTTLPRDWGLGVGRLDISALEHW